MTAGQAASVTRGRWDPLIGRLQALRQAAGEPSFAELARRISARRIAEGADEHAARIARSSVHDAFRLGRTRVNVDLVREIVVALDADPAVVDEWLTGLSTVGPVEPYPAEPGPAGGDPTEHTTAEPDVHAPPPAAPDAADPGPVVRDPGHPAPATTDRATRPLVAAAVLMLVCVVANRLGAGVTTYLHLAIYLDMVGTAVAAIVLGPWRGAVVGVLTNVVGAVVDGPTALPFALVNVVGALVWGYGVRRFGFGRSLPRFFALNLLVAVCCTLVAAPILVLMYDGSVGKGQDGLTDTFLQMTHQLAISVGMGNLLTSLGDKVITGFLALVAVSALPATLRAGCRLTPATDQPPAPPA
jgi:energy-coupling factor transport system substrate-specific component